MKYSILILFSISIFFLIGCKKDQAPEKEVVVVDSRDVYTGVFDFQTIRRYWNDIQPGVFFYDTSYYRGEVRYLNPSDYSHDMDYSPDHSNIEEKVAIVFRSVAGDNLISTAIDSTGTLDSMWLFGYFQNGRYSTIDSLSFKFGYDGANGGGSSYSVQGIRVP